MISVCKDLNISWLGMLSLNPTVSFYFPVFLAVRFRITRTFHPSCMFRLCLRHDMRADRRETVLLHKVDISPFFSRSSSIKHQRFVYIKVRTIMHFDSCDLYRTQLRNETSENKHVEVVIRRQPGQLHSILYRITPTLFMKSKKQVRNSEASALELHQADEHIGIRILTLKRRVIVVIIVQLFIH